MSAAGGIAMKAAATPGTAMRTPQPPKRKSEGSGEIMGVKPPFTPRPRPQQTWVHSCCSAAKLERALQDPDVSAIEADIMMGPAPAAGKGGSGTAGSNGVRTSLNGTANRIPVMAHPTWRRHLPPEIDLTFAEFIDRCIADGTRHLKLDFKELECVEPCLLLLAQRWPQLHSNGQAIWLNADVLPGPNARGACLVPAHTFLPLCRRLCPGAVLSLGWTVGPLGPEEAYSELDINEMARTCNEFDVPGSSVVVAASLRFSERCVPLFAQLLRLMPEAQLLFWTGTGELPVHPASHSRVSGLLANLGFAERVGFDVQIARSCCQMSGSRVVDCAFFWSRWSRWLCGCASYANASRLVASTGVVGLGERQPLVRDSSSHAGMRTPNNSLTPQPMTPAQPPRMEDLPGQSRV